jgi:hypothetical protein
MQQLNHYNFQIIRGYHVAFPSTYIGIFREFSLSIVPCQNTSCISIINILECKQLWSFIASRSWGSAGEAGPDKGSKTSTHPGACRLTTTARMLNAQKDKQITAQNTHPFSVLNRILFYDPDALRSRLWNRTLHARAGLQITGRSCNPLLQFPIMFVGTASKYTRVRGWS